MRRGSIQLYPIILVLLLTGTAASASTLQEKLEQHTDYVPPGDTVRDQLIDVAQHFHVPAAIEWLVEENEKPPPKLSSDKRTLRELIKAIVDQSPRHQMLIHDRLVYVFPPAAVNSKLNFLNLRIDTYHITNESILGANDELQLCINEKLYPHLYDGGINGGYGGPPGLLWKENISLSLDNRTIREILDEVIVESGLALWIVELTPDELKGDQPKWVGIPLDEHGQSPLGGRWNFQLIVPEESEKVDISGSNLANGLP